MDDLHYLSATDALRMFRARELSPVELVQSVIARAEAVDPTVNALCHRFFERAVDQARAAEDRYMGRGEPPRPLEGIPTAVKEEEPIAGAAMDAGLAAVQGSGGRRRPRASPQRILDSGAIVHARSTAPEFSCAGFTHSRLTGVTRNPWNPEYGVGGSSGGSGASLAAGHDHAGQRLRHRRLDPDPGVVQRRGRLQAALRAGAADRRRSTSTRTATAARWPAPWPTACCSRTCSPGPAPARHRLAAAQAGAARPARRGRGHAHRGLGRPRRLAGRRRGAPKHARHGRRRCASRAPSSRRSTCTSRGPMSSVPRPSTSTSASRAWIAGEAEEHGDLMTAVRARDATLGGQVGRRAARSSRSSSSRASCTRRWACCSSATTR